MEWTSNKWAPRSRRQAQRALWRHSRTCTSRGRPGCRDKGRGCRGRFLPWTAQRLGSRRRHNQLSNVSSVPWRSGTGTGGSVSGARDGTPLIHGLHPFGAHRLQRLLVCIFTRNWLACNEGKSGKDCWEGTGFV